MADSREPAQHGSDAPSTPNTTTRLFPPYLLWFVLVPALPFFFSVASLSFFIDSTQPTAQVLDKGPSGSDTQAPAAETREIFVKKLFSIKIDYIDEPFKILTHLSNLLTYLSTTAVHGIACLFVIGFFFYQIHQLPKDLIKRAYLYIGITTATFFMLAVIVRIYANDLILTQLGYKSICILLSKAELQTSLVWPDPGTVDSHTGEACFHARNTRLVWLAYTPIMLGMLAVMMASVFTTVMASAPIPSADKQWRPQFLSRIKLLQKSFYLLSLVLVTSTITILYFTSLPLELLKDNALVSALGKFFNGLTAFWGGLFTATLFATFTPAALLLIRQARNYQSGPATPSGLGQWFYENVFVSIKRQAMNVLVMIAPMLVGPFSDLLKGMSGLTS